MSPAKISFANFSFIQVAQGRLTFRFRAAQWWEGVVYVRVKESAVSARVLRVRVYL